MIKYIQPESVYKCPKTKEFFFDEDKYCKNCPYFKGSGWYERQWSIKCSYEGGD